MWGTRMTIQPFLLLVLSPFVIFDSDYALILCPLCKSNTLWNIFIILAQNVMLDRTRRGVSYKNDNFGLSPILVFEFDFVSAL